MRKHGRGPRPACRQNGTCHFDRKASLAGRAFLAQILLHTAYFNQLLLEILWGHVLLRQSQKNFGAPLQDGEYPFKFGFHLGGCPLELRGVRHTPMRFDGLARKYWTDFASSIVANRNQNIDTLIFEFIP